MPPPFRLAIVPAIAALALALGVGSAGALTSVTLELHGGHGKRSSVICGARRQYTHYHPGDRVRFDGTIPGAVGGFKVRIKIKQCVHGSFVTLFETHVRGRNGHFAGGFRARARGFYSIRGYYSGQMSAKCYLRVS
jgi:hypothetical protein